MPRIYRNLLSLLLVAAAPGVWGQEVEPVAVTHPTHTFAGRFEVSGSATFAVFTQLTDHGGFDASVAYNILDTLAVELRVGYTFSGQTSLAREVSQRVQSRDPATSLRITDDFSGLWEMKGHAVLGARYTPIYGKLSLFSEVPVHFQAYIWAGAGAGTFERTSLVICHDVTSRVDGTCADPLTESRGRFLASFAVGWRFLIDQHSAVKLEFRNYLYPDAYRVDIDRVAAEAGQPTGHFTPTPGVTPIWMLEAGYTFLF